jgi:hypothetical protein
LTRDLVVGRIDEGASVKGCEEAAMNPGKGSRTWCGRVEGPEREYSRGRFDD